MTRSGLKLGWKAAVTSPVGRTALAAMRIWLGYQWLTAGVEKLTNPAWVGPQAGAAVTAFLKGALTKAGGPHPDVQGWYAAFLRGFALPHAVGFSYLISTAEALVGATLILGLFTSAALFGGLAMNLAYLLAGTVSTNPILFTVGAFLLALGPETSFEGLDRFLAQHYRRWYERLTEGVGTGRPAHQH